MNRTATTIGSKLHTPTSPWPARSLLGRLAPVARDELIQLGRAFTQPDRQPILTQGDDSRHSFLLLSGSVRVVAESENGEPALLAVRTRGDLVGEMAELTGEPRSATVVSSTPIAAKVIAGRELRAFLSRRPEAALAVAAVITGRLEWANARRLDFTRLSPCGRVSRVLTELTGSPHRAVLLTQSDVAALAGVGLATAERVLQELQAAGLVRLLYRRILIADLNGLRQRGKSPRTHPVE